MDNETNETLKKGVIKSFEVLESTRRVIADEMLTKTVTLLGIMITGEAKERKDEGDALVKSMEKDQAKIDMLTKLIELKEDCVKLFDDEE